MNSFLWTQNEKPTIPSTLIIDHIRSEFEGNADQKEAMKVLSSTSSWENVKGIEGRGNLEVQIKLDEAIVVSSCFKTIDASGRPMPFSFYCKNDDIYEVIKELKVDLEELRDSREYDHTELDNSTIQSIADYISQKKKKENLRWFVLFLILGISLLIKFLS